MIRRKRTRRSPCCEEAVATGREDQPDRPGLLCNRGKALRSRYRRTARTADLRAAVDIGEQSVSATPTDHSGRPMFLANLAETLHEWYAFTDRPADLDDAVDTARAAIAAGSPRHPYRGAHLSLLAGPRCAPGSS